MVVVQLRMIVVFFFFVVIVPVLGLILVIPSPVVKSIC
jgi:hypothetical protein